MSVSGVAMLLFLHAQNCLESCGQSSSGGAVSAPTSLQEWADFLPTDDVIQLLQFSQLCCG